MSFGVMNPWFNFQTYTPEQDFYSDFIDEEIRITGVEALYIPKDVTAIDDLLGESYQAVHDRFYPMPVRVTDIMGYSGSPDTMSQFGVQFEPETEIIISKRMFKGMKIPERDLRPHEGDLILIGSYQATAANPRWTNSLFEMTYVKRDTPNWPLGRYYVWSIHCQLYVVSYDKFNTGSSHIDRINSQYGNEADLVQGNNSALEKKKEVLVDFTETNPFGNL